jgi:beta-glucosidase
VKELKGFQRVALGPGRSARAQFTLRREDLAFTGLDGRPVIEPGQFLAWIGPNSAEGLRGEFSLDD